jgi:hypothetical protein
LEKDGNIATSRFTIARGGEKKQNIGYMNALTVMLGVIIVSIK